MRGLVCLLLGGPDYVIVAGGKAYRFEMHPYFGPNVVNKRGDIAENQPGPRSPFWDAVTLWDRQGQRTRSVGKDKFCVWEPLPPVRAVRIGKRSGLIVPDGVPDDGIDAWFHEKCRGMGIEPPPFVVELLKRDLY